MRTLSLLGMASLLVFITYATVAGQAITDTSATQTPSGQKAETPKSFSDFSNALTDVVFVGNFTVTGNNNQPLREDRYEISRVTKLPSGDYWLFYARIKYGQHDVTLPLPLEVKWAGKTPVITLDNVTIPALGTFNARVLIDGDRYAGTWTHGKVGGHMFGKIEKGPSSSDEKSP